MSPWHLPLFAAGIGVVAAMTGVMLAQSFVLARPAPPRFETAVHGGAFSGAPITMVELSATHTLSGRFWRLTYRSDFSAERSADVERDPGTFDGRIDPMDWKQLVLLLERSGFEYWDSAYSQPGMKDGETVFVTVSNGSESKRVECRGVAGPSDLWVVQQVLKGMAESVNWKRVASEGAR